MRFESQDDVIQHIGIKRRSGRYPWGSGKDPYQRSQAFKSYYDGLKKQGLTDTQIAEGIGLHLKKTSKGPYDSKFSTTDLRAAIAISTEEIRAANVAMAVRLKNRPNGGLSNVAIGKRMGVNESVVRGWLKASENMKKSSLRATADALKQQLESKPFIDVGEGQHLYLGVTYTKFRTALAMLKDEGYQIHTGIKLPQLGIPGQFTYYKVLTKAGHTWKEAKDAVFGGRLSTIEAQSDDGGLTFMRPKQSAPISADLKRIDVRWADEKGVAAMDGVIELRRGVPELSLGANSYAQVRIAVNGTHYLKGMAMYADDLPDGVDIRVNSNKPPSSDKLAAMKPMKMFNGKIDEENPFGSSTYPRMYKDASGKEHQSLLNVVGSKGAGNVEGRWDEWSKSLSSQMLSKQSVALASKQLGITQDTHQKEFDDIMSMTNPVVRQRLLMDFADNADAAAVHLKAAAMPRQSTHVLLPINSINPKQIYAPNFNPGEKVVLVRYPHAGPFEIPELTVNNNNRQAKRILGGAKDAVGIHYSVASQLSGADFDGDAVLVIPNNSRAIKTKPPLAALKNFDAKAEYAIPEGDTKIVRMTKANTQTEMGKISNLITDMSIKDAPEEDIARAVKHSMVVIDAEKHGLNYKQSELDNGIKELKVKYQGASNAGASTLISRASADTRIPQVRPRRAAEGGPIDPKTGEKVFVPTGNSFEKTVTRTSKRTGETVSKVVTVQSKTKGSAMEFAKNAEDLLSSGGGTPIEKVYANYANSMKTLANRARRESLAVETPKVSASAKALYSKEVDSLNAKLKVAQKNAPLERRAQAIAQAMARDQIDSHPEWDKDDVKKAKFRSLQDARELTGANKTKVNISDREWEAIQARAVAPTKLRTILTQSDMERVKELARPHARSSLTPGQIARAKSMRTSGKSLSEIASALGIPRSTISDNLKAS